MYEKKRLAKIRICRTLFYALVGSIAVLPINAAFGEPKESVSDARVMTLDEVREALEISDAEALRKSERLTTKGASVQSYITDTSQADRIREIRRRYEPKVVYGPDDRIDYGVAIREHPELASIFNTSVAMFDANDVSESGRDKVILRTVTLAEKKKLCPDERFRDQAVGAFCTGILVAKDTVLTAGHCVKEISNDLSLPRIDRVAFVFGFHAEDEGDRGATELDSSRVFYGKRAMSGVLEPDTLEDWGIVQLDRNVPPEVATPILDWGMSSVKEDDGVYVVGYPTGMPFKYAPNSIVRDNDEDAYFTANLDTFGGNSGSGVFRTDTNELVGILVRGDTDYVWDRRNSCRVVNVCPTSGCKGEHVMRTAAVTQD